LICKIKNLAITNVKNNFIFEFLIFKMKKYNKITQNCYIFFISYNKTVTMIFDRKNLTDNQLLDLYKRILKPRLIEEKCSYSSGKSFKMVLRNGQAISVGVTAVLDSDEYILPAEIWEYLLEEISVVPPFFAMAGES
jgi:hypothetical protein